MRIELSAQCVRMRTQSSVRAQRVRASERLGVTQACYLYAAQHRAKIDQDLLHLFPPNYTPPRWGTCAVVGSAGD